ncbi:MAG: HEAT repeat domain-containing protein [Pirellulales bacterium]
MSAEVEALIQSLRGNDGEARQSAAERLAQLGPDAQAAAVPLVEACAIDDDNLREFVTAALEELGPPLPSEVGTLAALVSHVSLDVAYWAATLLGRLKDHAASAVDALAMVLDKHPQGSVKQRAAWALGQIGPAAESARGTLQQAAAGSDKRLARLAQEALDKLPG